MMELLQKTLEVEQRQKQRASEISLMRKKEEEKQKELDLMTENDPASNFALDQEENQRRALLDNMSQNSTPAVASIVKVLNHSHCKYTTFNTLIH